MMNVCKICNMHADLRTHLRIHGVTSKEYYDKYLKKDNEGICPTCKKPTKFLGISNGYRTFCSNECHQQNTEATQKRIASLKASGKGKERRKNTWKNKTDDEKSRIVEKMKKTNETKYGVVWFSKTKDCKEAVSQKNSAACSQNWKNGIYSAEKMAAAYCDRHNIKNEQYANLFQIPAVKKKIKQTKLERYGDENYLNEERRYKTCLMRFGTPYPMQNHEIFTKARSKYTYDGKTFDSSAEICYYIWLKDHNVDFEYQPNLEFEYEYAGKTHKYFPDFRIGDELIEIKGAHFFENGKMINPFDRTQDALYEAKHQCMIRNDVKIITDYTEYEKYVNEKFTYDGCKQFRNK